MNKLAWLLLLVGISAQAQLSNVTATVKDSDNQTWNNGTFQITFVPPTGYTGTVYTFNGTAWTPTVHQGNLSNVGLLTALGVERNDFIVPANSHWKFSICPNASYRCSDTTLTINQAMMDVTSQLVLSAPRFAASNLATGSFGYADVEVSPIPPIGNSYFNVNLSSTCVYKGSPAFMCSGATVLAGDATGPVQSNTVVGVNGNPVPPGSNVIGTDTSGHLIDQSLATLSNNTTGNAATATQANHALNLPADFATQSSTSPAAGAFTSVSSSNGVNLKSSNLSEELPNNPSSGATLNLLVCVNNLGQAQTCTTSSASWSGIAIGGATGTSTGNTQLARGGQTPCIFDGATTIGHYATISSTVAGDCHDTGSTSLNYPASGFTVLGRILTANTGNGTLATVNLFSPGIVTGNAFLASCSGSLATDASTIQAALTGAAINGGHVEVVGAVCNLNTHLVVSCPNHSTCTGVWLDMGASTINYNSSPGDYVIGTSLAAGTETTRTCTDVVVTAASNTITSTTCNFTASDVGSDIIISGAMNSQTETGCGACTSSNLVAQISSVTNATTAVITAYTTPQLSVSPASITLYNRDQNIIVSGGFIVKSGTQGPCGLCLEGVTNLTVKDINQTMISWDAGIVLAAITNLVFDNINVTTSANNNLVFYAPLVIGEVHNVRVTSASSGTGINLNGFYSPFGFGPIQNFEIDDITTTGTIGYAVNMQTNDGGFAVPIKTISIAHAKAFNASYGVYLRIGQAFDDILIEDLNGAYGANAMAVGGATVGNLTIKDISYTASNNGAISLVGTTKPLVIDNLTIDGVFSNGQSINNTTVPYINVSPGNGGPVTINQMSINNIKLYNLTNGGPIIFMGNSNNYGITINDLIVNNAIVTTSLVTPFLDFSGGSLALIKNLTLNSVHFTTTAPAGAGTPFLYGLESGGGLQNINNIVMNDIVYNSTNVLTGTTAYLYYGGGVVGNIAMSNVHLSNITGCINSVGTGNSIGSQSTITNLSYSGITSPNTCTAWLFGQPVVTVSGTAQAASIGSTNLFTVPTLGGGGANQYRVTCIVWPGTVGAGTVSITSGVTSAVMSLAASTNNATITFPYNNAIAGTAINYSTTYVGPGTYNYGCDLMRIK